MHADMVLVNGKIVTMNPEESIAEAVAVKYSRLLKVGSNLRGPKESRGPASNEPRQPDARVENLPQIFVGDSPTQTG